MENNLLERIRSLEAKVAHQQETIEFLLDFVGYGTTLFGHEYGPRDTHGDADLKPTISGSLRTLAGLGDA